MGAAAARANQARVRRAHVQARARACVGLQQHTCVYVCVRACRFVATQVVAGPEHGAAVDKDGELELWGSNEFQQCGAMGVASVIKPQVVPALALKKVLAVACGGSHTLAIVSDSAAATSGTLMAWGTGTVGQLGLDRTVLLADEPAVVTLPSTRGKPVAVSRVYAGLVTSAAVDATGDLFVWGDASLGRLGLPNIAD
ncbi:hypothetical protein EON67_09060, partial [archaeon]